MRRPITGARSIRYRLVAVVMVTTLAALMVSIGTVIGYDLRNYHRALIGDMATQAELVGHMTSAALTFDDPRLARENLALLRIRPSVRAGAIYNANGALFASYQAPGQKEPLPERPEAASIRVQGNDLVLYEKIVENGEFLGTVYLRAEYALVSRILDYLVIAAGVTLLAMLLAWLL
ncbi:MAG: hybrid sensor histidine kinase/response regulator, partial [Massilia sp.]|nr:hybrid sensor histidine kinase/response regulator [Massilia sp.]